MLKRPKQSCGRGWGTARWHCTTWYISVHQKHLNARAMSCLLTPSSSSAVIFQTKPRNFCKLKDFRSFQASQFFLNLRNRSLFVSFSFKCSFLLLMQLLLHAFCFLSQLFNHFSTTKNNLYSKGKKITIKLFFLRNGHNLSFFVVGGEGGSFQKSQTTWSREINIERKKITVWNGKTKTISTTLN